MVGADYNFAGNNGAISPLNIQVSNDTYTGEKFLEKYIRAYEYTLPRTDLANLFPVDEQAVTQIFVKQYYNALNAEIWPVVQRGGENPLLYGDRGQTHERFYKAINLRVGFNIQEIALNIATRPGSMDGRGNELMPGEERLQEEVDKILASHSLTWDVWRAMMLNGGIFYTDPRTGVRVEAPAHLPSWNLWDFQSDRSPLPHMNVQPPRNAFRTIVDDISNDVATAGVPWTDPDASIVSFFRVFKKYFKDTNKVPLTDVWLHPEAENILMNNRELQNMMRQLMIPGFGLPVGTRTTSDAIVAPQGTLMQHPMNYVTIADGSIQSICGVRINYLETKFRDPETNQIRGIIPKNRAIFVSTMDPNGSAEAPGTTFYTISEDRGGAPGLWVRQFENQSPIHAPGRSWQWGNAGLPVLIHPNRIAHVTFATVEQVNDAQRVQGDPMALVR